MKRMLLPLLLVAAVGGCARPTPKEELKMGAYWDMVEDYPPAFTGSFWWPDDPKDLGAKGIGRLPAEGRVYLTQPRLGNVELGVELPPHTAELPVYLLGGYPEEKGAEVATLGIAHPECEGVVYSLVWCISDNKPIGPVLPIRTEDDAVVAARKHIGKLWMEDYRLEQVERREEGWSVKYTQYIGDIPILMDKSLQLNINDDGQLLYLLVRRRPMLAKAAYPLRTPEDAYGLLKEGKAFGTTLVAGAENTELATEHFRVEHVDLAYIVTHFNEPVEVMQPYYRFRSTDGHVMLIPAVADPYVTWPW